MISALCWVPKGAFKVVPVVAEPPTKEEIEEVLRTGLLFRRGNDDEEEDEDMHVDGSPEVVDEVALARTAAKALNQGQVGTVSSNVHTISNGIDELNMDDYDDEDDGIELFGSGIGDTYYPSNDMDPYLQKHGDDDDDDDDDAEDTTIRPTDFGIVCARNEDEVSHLEVWIYEDLEDGDSNMYVHHDIILPAFPLCTAWTDCNLKGGDKGNFLAVGSMDPAIEIWDLDLIEEVQPSVVLGGVSKKKKKGNKKSLVYRKDSHRDSILGLAWNKVVRNALASASADKSVKIWDVVTGKCVASVQHHTDKVQSVAWKGSSPEQLLSGSFDKSVIMVRDNIQRYGIRIRGPLSLEWVFAVMELELQVDVRSINEICNKWLVTADVESLAWDPHVDHTFVVSQENGVVQGFDIRSVSSDASSSGRPVFTLHGHDKAVSSMSYNPRKPNLLATGSTDKTVKLWDLSNNQPSCLASKNPKAGSIFSIAFSEDNPYLLAVGGHKGKLNIWDISSEPGMGDIIPAGQIRSIN